MLTALAVLAVVIAALIAFAASRPANFRIERRTHIAAPPERVYPLVADFRRWTAWSPWENKDPNLKRTYSGAERGTGAIYGWEGDKRIGHGRMEIKDAAPSSRVLIQLDFLKPFEAHNQAEFTFTPKDGGTDVLWAMTGPHPLLFRLMSVVMSMEKMVGPDFEAGLANMKRAAEAGA